MTQDQLTPLKDRIVGKLEAAGTRGLSKSALGVKGKGRAAEALKALEAEGTAVNLGSRSKTVYVHKTFNRPVALAAEALDQVLLKVPLRLFSRTRLKERPKGLPAQVKKALDKGLERLTAEGRVLKLRYGGFDVYTHAGPVRSRLETSHAVGGEEAAAGAETAPAIDPEAVAAAYGRVRVRSGFSNVEISSLARELDVPLEGLKAFLLEQSRQGRAVLSMGDWSLASEEVRAGAVMLRGKPHLLVRFKDR